MFLACGESAADNEGLDTGRMRAEGVARRGECALRFP